MPPFMVLEGKRSFGRPRYRLEDNIKLELKDGVWGFGQDSMHTE